MRKPTSGRQDFWAEGRVLLGSLSALEDNDRNLALCQRLLLLDVGHEALERFPLLGTRGPRASFELVGTYLDGCDRSSEQILVPARMRRGTIPRCNDDVAIAVLPKSEHRRPFLPGLRARRGQQHECPACHRTAELPTIGAELLDQLAIERLHVRRDLSGRLPMGRLFGTHDLIWIMPTQFFPGSMNPDILHSERSLSLVIFGANSALRHRELAVATALKDQRPRALIEDLQADLIGIEVLRR